MVGQFQSNKNVNCIPVSKSTLHQRITFDEEWILMLIRVLSAGAGYPIEFEVKSFDIAGVICSNFFSFE